MALTPQQQANRLLGVGGSEVLAACGKDPRCSMLELYQRKIGELPAPDLSDDERVHFGAMLEPVIRKEVSRRLGTQVIQRHETLFHADAPLVGHIDGWIRSQRCGVELKNVDRFEAADYGEPGTDQVPTRHWLQCAAYMALTGANRWHLAAFVGGNDLRLYLIERNPQVETFILESVRSFWRHVEQRQPPEPKTVSDVRLRWPKDLGTTVLASREILHVVRDLHGARAELSNWTRAVEALEIKVKKFMGDHAELIDAHDSTLATWRTAKSSNRFDQYAFAVDHPDLFKQYNREQVGARRFLLK